MIYRIPCKSQNPQISPNPLSGPSNVLDSRSSGPIGLALQLHIVDAVRR